MKRILLVEDDSTLGETLQERLQKEGYEVSWCSTLLEAKEQMKLKSVDLAVLDIGLPDGSGLDLAKWIRRQTPNVVFLFLTAQSSAEVRLEGFEIGAEEFIPKPFHLKELLLRVRHVLENHRHVMRIDVGKRQIDLTAMCVILPSGEREFFQTRDFKTLSLLIEKAPEVLSRDQILNDIWGEDKFPSNRTVDNTIVRLRQMIGDGKGDWIRSVRGVGYQWCPPEGNS